MRRSIPHLVFRLFAAAISAMLLFDGSAFAAKPEPAAPRPAPGSPDLLSTVRVDPTRTACAIMEN
ncbi:MAG: hypothetical protein WD178_01780, partial [Actinomycetota bacterium]